MSGWCWFGVAPDQPAGTVAAATAADLDGGTLPLAAWLGERGPAAGRIDRRVVDAAGPPMAVSLALVPAGVRVLFDDPAVVRATQAVLERPWPAFVSTVTSDSAHIAGAVTGIEPQVAEARPAWWGEDPFARVFPARRLLVGAGLFRRVAPFPGPVHQRYGGAPWPVAGFPHPVV